MEASIFVIAELLFALLAPFCAVASAAATAVFDLLAGLFGIALSSSRLRRWGVYAAGAVLVPAAVAALLVELVFFDPVARWALDRAAARTGAELTVERLGGSLIGTRLELESVTLTRAPGAKAGLDLHARRAAVDLAPLSLLSPAVRLHDVAVAGVRGSVTAAARGPEDAAAPRPARRFRADVLAVADAEIALHRDAQTHLLAVERLSAEPMRSDMAVFDLFFRSNLRATLDGAAIGVETEARTDREGRATQWRLDRVPAQALATAIPRAPVSWLGGGTLSVVVDDAWDIEAGEDRPLTDRTRIDTDWQITLSGVTVAPPPQAGRTERLFAGALAKVVNGSEDDVTFGFAVTLEEGMFRDAVSLDGARLWDALLRSWAEELARRTGESADASADRLRATGGRLREMLQRDAPAEEGE